MSPGTVTLESFFRENPRVAIACSGGTDSAYLVHEAVRLGADVLPVIVRSQLACPGEVGDAVAFCRSQGVEPAVVDVDAMGIEGLAANGPDRCYHCKRALFGAVAAKAAETGYPVVADGTNASDPADERPGMRALAEMGIRSPLREAGLTKDMIRDLSRSGGLATWDRPSNSCLATRVATGVRIDPDVVRRIGEAEEAVGALGFRGFRLRTDGERAWLQTRASERDAAVARSEEIGAAVSPWFADFRIDEVTRDG